MYLYHRIRLSVLVLLLQLVSLSVFAETEGQMARTAEKYFNAKQYDRASPIYAQLVSSNPKNFRYNYYYGICLLINSGDKNAALTYLEKAFNNSKTPEEIYYYMGRALHLTYNFELAIKAFTEFNTIIGTKNLAVWQTPQQIGMINNAIQLLDTLKNSEITAATESPAEDFYKIYAFENPNGKLLSMPDDVIKASKSDNDEKPMIYLSANNRVMYYSAKSQETASRDIYRVEKDLDNNWGAPERIITNVNTTQDELFPTCNSDGRILYFSSRGHNSTGGFDVFKSYYNTVSHVFSTPENMGSPVNSPDDDFCFVASTEERSAYFASARITGPGVLTVFKMKYTDAEKLPVAINGRFKCIGQPEVKVAKITITKLGEDAPLASITTDSTNGNYALELPGLGTYNFKVEVAGFATQTQDVIIGEFSDNIFVQDIMLSRNYNGIENLAVSSRRLSEADQLDATLTASSGEDDGASAGLTAHDVGMQTVTENDRVKLPSMQGVNFKVQIGAFKKLKKEVVQKRLASKTDVTSMTDSKDITWLRFYLGNEKTYTSAKNLRTTLINAGFKDAFITSFDGSTPIPIKDAINLTTSIK